jgi:hypothetical protein
MRKIAPRTNFNATRWGFTTRDFGIIAVGLLLGIAQVITPYASIFVRLILFAVIVLGAVTIAFWRLDGVLTIEEFLIKRIKRWGGVRDAFTKTGADSIARQQYTAHAPPAEEKKTPTAAGKVLGWLPAWLIPGSNQELVFTMAAIFCIFAVGAWIGTGGVKEAQVLMNNFARSL